MSSKKLHEHSLYERLFENAFSAMLITDPDTSVILDANNAAIDFYQYPKDQLIGMTLNQLNADSEELIQKEMRLALNQKRNHFIFTHRTQPGDTKEVEVYTGPIEFKKKKLLCSIIHDISDRKKAEDRLKKSESTIRAMINATSNLVYLFDLKGRIIDMNLRGAALFKKTPEEMIGRLFVDFFSENDFTRIKTLVTKVVTTRESLSYQKERDDKTYEINIYPVFNDDNRVDLICIYGKDITDLKKTEKVFAAIETAGGICHEMNQPLQVILGNLELLKLNIAKDDPSRKLIDVLMAQTDRLGAITKKLTHITRYETKEYIKGTIFDIDKSTDIK